MSERTAASPGPRVLRTEDLVKKYRKRAVVNGVSVTVSRGETVGLLGPNGAGKTTTFNQIVGFITPDSGDVFMDDIRLTHLPMYRRCRLGIGYLPQESSVFRKMTVADNLMSILETTGLRRRERKERQARLLSDLGIEKVADQKAFTLSGGERRRVEIARALVTDPAFLLLDEPFAGIDPIAVDDIQGIIRDLRARGLGILITDHNVRETLAITDRAYIMYDGRILISGSAQELAEDPEARKIYLGERFRL
ncbi:MAG: LPS export ABC transporter ATP-binding protein [Candidatus Fermentibacteraceae bacterium]|nr:LPS export ABC transporter ATP-binding protein [Candidatus Fermentibacteraceae bacterium]MBN2607995.1 LPS export ABC transporter ATP-binding protein [Candidatus Fermentibacteraceae bacterium]